jgi:hypothetical protein
MGGHIVTHENVF